MTAHSVWMAWASLDSLFATTFSRPGIFRALRLICFLVHQVKILHRRAHSWPNPIPPFLFMYDTTVVLSVAIRTILSEHRSWNSFRANIIYMQLAFSKGPSSSCSMLSPTSHLGIGGSL